MLASVSRQFAEVYAQYEFRKLQEQVAKLQLENYYLKLPSLRDCMVAFNGNNDIDCWCLCCAMRWGIDEERVRDSFDCSWVPKWEAFLQEAGATWPSALDPWPEQLLGGHGDTHHAVYTVGRRDWVFSGWGRPLSSLDSPRRKVWDTIVQRASEPSSHDDDDAASSSSSSSHDDDDAESSFSSSSSSPLPPTCP